MRLSAEFTEENIFRVRELLLGDFKNFPAVVAGDFMLDRYATSAATFRAFRRRLRFPSCA